jgi:hypothetical protein
LRMPQVRAAQKPWATPQAKAVQMPWVMPMQRVIRKWKAAVLAVQKGKVRAQCCLHILQYHSSECSFQALLLGLGIGRHRSWPHNQHLDSKSAYNFQAAERAQACKLECLQCSSFLQGSSMPCNYKKVMGIMAALWCSVLDQRSMGAL